MRVSDAANTWIYARRNWPSPPAGQIWVAGHRARADRRRSEGGNENRRETWPEDFSCGSAEGGVVASRAAGAEADMVSPAHQSRAVAEQMPEATKREDAPLAAAGAGWQLPAPDTEQRRMGNDSTAVGIRERTGRSDAGGPNAGSQSVGDGVIMRPTEKRGVAEACDMSVGEPARAQRDADGTMEEFMRLRSLRIDLCR